MEASGASACVGELLAGQRGSLIVEEELPLESDLRGIGPRTGVFVCHCGINIGGVVDVPAVVEYVKTLPTVVYATDNLFTCSQDAAVKMAEVIREQNLTRVVVASCSPRTHEGLFQENCEKAGLNRYLFEMANIRDQDSWVHMHEPEKATAKGQGPGPDVRGQGGAFEAPETGAADRQPCRADHRRRAWRALRPHFPWRNRDSPPALWKRKRNWAAITGKLHYTLEGLDTQRHLAGLLEEVKNNDFDSGGNGSQDQQDGRLHRQLQNHRGYGRRQARSLNTAIVIVATGGYELTTEEYLYGSWTRS